MYLVSQTHLFVVGDGATPVASAAKP
jgi:hypothetical protein